MISLLVYVVVWQVLYMVFCPMFDYIIFLFGTGDVMNVGALLRSICNWKFVLSSPELKQIAFTIYIFWNLLGYWVWDKFASERSKSADSSSAHGSARFLTDKEFSKLFPSYIFRPNEQEEIRKSKPIKFEKAEDNDVFALLESDFGTEVKDENQTQTSSE